ncbi:WbqC family protein [Dysgonomonas sp. Marseille-P4677]|uniref:WbqC family protein n=1 Tax=Dysgonomonas sp. Marseille-P4677 TaxID=2364790 RepID=UPI001912D743|nr:WbqC family protein [Dysgonomonas sp. Marseille-P4677]MBK5721087.1 WbqC family protein [Dysgonomonas sp. Marseille-P4677]
MDIYLTSAYLAPIQYYAKFLSAESIFIEQHDNYIKQTYRNRCNIISANGEIPLSIPVEHSSKAKIAMKDIRIAKHGNWQHMHWNAIVSAYNSTPFFEYYQDDFYPFYHKEFDFLFDFNEELRTLILCLLNIDLPEIKYTEYYKVDFGQNEIDLREIIHPKRDWRTLDSDFLSVDYYQVFNQKLGFTPNMSIIDLLFNMGNESQIILSKSII